MIIIRFKNDRLLYYLLKLFIIIQGVYSQEKCGKWNFQKSFCT